MDRKISLSLAYMKKRPLNYIGIFFVLVFVIVSVNVLKIVDYNTSYENLMGDKEYLGSHNLEIISNKDLSKDIKGEDYVKSAYSNIELGEINIGNKYKSRLYTFTPEYLAGNGYKLKDGRFPNKSNEILLDKKYCEKVKIGDVVGKDVLMQNLYNEDKFKSSYKVVGIVEKNMHMAANKSAEYPSKAFVFLSNDLLKKYKDFRYTIFVEFKDGFKNVRGHSDDLREVYTGIESIDIPQSEVGYRVFNDSKSIYESLKSNISVFIISFSFIICMFVLMEKDMIRDIGKIRLIAFSKKEANGVIFKLYAILTVISNVFGIALCYVISYIVLRYLKSADQITNIYLFKQNGFVLLTIIAIDILIVILNKLFAYKTRNMSINDQINYRYSPKLFKGISKKISHKLIERSIIGNIVIFVAIISTSATGILYTEVYSDTLENSISYNRLGYLYAHNQYALGESLDTLDDKIRFEDVYKLSDIKSVENIFIRSYMDSRIKVDSERLTKEYLSTNKLASKESKDIEIRSNLELMNIDDDVSEEMKRFLHKGKISDIGKIASDGYINVAFMNSNMKGDYTFDVLKDAKIGDKFVLTVDDGNGAERKIGVRIVAFISPGWRVMGLSKGTFDSEIITDIDAFKKVMDVNYASSVSFDIKGDEDKAKKEISNFLVNKEIPFILQNKSDDLGLSVEKYRKFQGKIKMMSLFVISAVSTAAAIFTVFNNKKRETSTLIDIGASRHLIFKISIVECIVYAAITITITLPISLYNDYEVYTHAKDVTVAMTGMKGLVDDTYIPPKQFFIFIFFVIFLNVFFGLLNTYLNYKNRNKLRSS